MSSSNSSVSVASQTVMAGSSVVVTLTTKDQNGSTYFIPNANPTVVFSASGGTSTGSFGAVTNNNNGTYTANFVGVNAGTATTITATIDGVSVSGAASIQVTQGNFSLSNSYVTLSSNTVTSGSTVTATLHAYDSSNNALTSGGLTVSFAKSGGTSSGTFSAVTDNGNGTYTATFTASTAGTATTIFGYIGASALTSSAPTLTVTAGSGPLSAFTITSATVTASSAVHLIWASSTGATSYTVKYGTSSGTYGSTFSTSATSPADITGLTAGTTYYFMVTAVNSSGTVNATAEASATPEAAFTMTSVTPGVGTATLVWASASGATSYDILYGTSSGLATGTYASSSTGVSSGATISGLSAGSTYYFRIRANNANGSVLSTNELSSAVYQNFTMSIPFTSGTDSSYTFSNTSSVSLMSTGGVQLTAADQSDTSTNTGSSSGGFQNGTLTGVQWDSGTDVLRLNTTTNNAELDASWTPQWSSLVGYWKLNSDFNASIGTNLSSSGAGAAISNSSFKIGSGAASFDGASYSYAPAASTYSFPNTTFSVSLWLKTANSSGYMISNGASGGCGGWGIWNPGAPTLYLKNSVGGQQTLSTTTSVADGNWHHVVFVVTTDTSTSANNTALVYIDGTSQAVSASGATTYCDPTNTRALFLGARGTPGSPGNYLTGGLDEVAIWSAALTAPQVLAIYQRQTAKYSGQVTSRVMDALSSQSWTTLSSTTTLPFYKELPAASETSSGYSSQTASLMSGIVGLWHLDESSGATLYDSSGNGKNGTVIAGALGSNGILGNAMSGSPVGANLGSPLDISLGQAFSVSLWAKPTSFNNFMRLFSARQNDVSGRQEFTCWNYAAGSDTGIRLGCEIFENGAYAQAFYYTAGSIPLNQWFHMTISFDGAIGRLYLNGNLVLTGTSFAQIPSVTGKVWYLGSSGSGSASYMGSIDEFAIWNRSLSGNEVLELYRRGANRLKYQIRSCSASDCSDQDALTGSGKGWKGPDNTQLSYFSELYNTTSNVLGGTVSTGTPTMTFSNFGSLSVSSNRYFQYRAILESDDANNLCTYNSTAASCSPELQSVAIGPNHYDTTVQTVISKASLGTAYQTINTNGFTETLGTNSCSSGTKYAISPDGSSYYYYNGTTWTTSSDYTTANDAATMRSNISSFPGTIGTGTLQIKTFLKSSGTSACEVNNLQVTGKKY